MNKRMALASLLLGLIVVGLVAGLFAGSIQKALSAPMQQIMGGMGNTAPKAVVPVAPQPKQAAPAAPVVNTLAQDTFQRQNQQLWGTASDGRMWQGDANTANAFSIADGVGQIANKQGTLNALLGQPGTNMEVMVSGSLNQFNKGQVNLGAVLRWTDNNNWYKVLIDGTHVTLLRRANGATKTLATQPFQAQGGTMYSLRFRAIGAMLFARVWLVGSPEPQKWMLNVTDPTLPTGQAGVRVLLQDTSIATITTFNVLPATLGNTA